MIGGDVIAIENDDGSFTWDQTGMLWMNLFLNYTDKEDKVKNEACRIYNLFHKKDTGREKTCSLQELTELKNQGDCTVIIPKTKDTFIILRDWLQGVRSGMNFS